MTTEPPIIRQSELIGRLVINQNTAEELGRVAHLWLDPTAHQIIGASCKAGLLSMKKHRFMWSQIEAIGTESVMVSLPSGVEPDQPASAIAEINQSVWTDTGSRVGALTDYRFDRETGDVVDYLFAHEGWEALAKGTYCLPVREVIRLNEQRLIASEAAIRQSASFGGIQHGLAQVTEFLRTDYDRTQQDFQAIANQLQSATQRAKLKLSDVAGQLRGSSSESSKQLPEASLTEEEALPQDSHSPQDSPSQDLVRIEDTTTVPDATPTPDDSPPLQSTDKRRTEADEI